MAMLRSITPSDFPPLTGTPNADQKEIVFIDQIFLVADYAASKMTKFSAEFLQPFVSLTELKITTINAKDPHPCYTTQTCPHIFNLFVHLLEAYYVLVDMVGGKEVQPERPGPPISSLPTFNVQDDEAVELLVCFTCALCDLTVVPMFQMLLSDIQVA